MAGRSFSLWNTTRALLAMGVLASGYSLANAAPPGLKVAAAGSLWTIGEAEAGDHGLALAPNGWHRYARDSVFIVGRSTARRDWNYVLPGPDDAWAGSRTHHDRIIFGCRLLVPQSTKCLLRISFAGTQGELPTLVRTTINGHRFTKQLPGGENAQSINGGAGLDDPIHWDIAFPARWLHRRANLIDISSISGSWALYHRIALYANPALRITSASTRLLGATWNQHVLNRSLSGRVTQKLHLVVYNDGPPSRAIVKVSGVGHSLEISSGVNICSLACGPAREPHLTNISLMVSGRQAGHISAQCSVVPHLTIFALPHSHMDIGYGYLPATALRLHAAYINKALKLIKNTRGLPVGLRYKWNVESLIAVQHYLARASVHEIKRFRDAVLRGQICLGATYDNELSGLCSGNELLAMVQYADALRRRYGLPVDAAVQCDVPGATWGYVTVLADAGIKYFAWGPNYASPLTGGWLGSARNWDGKAFYWGSPSGKQKILVWQSVWGYQTPITSRSAIRVFIRTFEGRNPKYPYDFCYLLDALGDNAPPDALLPKRIAKWNRRYAWPRFKIGTVDQVFAKLARRYGNTIPTYCDNYNGYWSDGAASDARVTSVDRRARQLLTQDQILWDILQPAHYPRSKFQLAWQNAVLYDEHTWGAWDSFARPSSKFVMSQWKTKRGYAYRVRSIARTLRKGALSVVRANHRTRRFAVINTCSWERSGVVTLKKNLVRGRYRVKSPSGRLVCSQLLANGSLAFLARDVPPMGVRIYRVLSGSPHTSGHLAVGAGGDAIWNGLESLVVDRRMGTITAWHVKGAIGNLVKEGQPDNRGLNDYLYVLGPQGRLPSYATENPEITVIDKGPVVAEVRISGGAPGCRAFTRVVSLYRAMKRVHVTDVLEKRKVWPESEGVYLAFPFAVPQPVVRIGTPWAVFDPKTESLPISNYNYYAVSQFVDFSNPTFGVTWCTPDAPEVELGKIATDGSRWLPRPVISSTALSFIMNNYWHTNYKAWQRGRVSLSYDFERHGKFSRLAAERFSRGVAQPLIAVPFRKTRLPNFPLHVESADLIVAGCHPLGMDNGWLLRLFNVGHAPVCPKLAWNEKPLRNVFLSSLFGRKLTVMPAGYSIAPMDLATLVVKPP